LQHVSLAARKGSDEYILAVTFAFYPGSCPPFGGEQIQRAAAPYFRLICQGNGRLDFIETMNQWDRTWTFDRASLKDPMLALRRLWAISKVIPRLLLDADMRQRLEYVWRGYDTEGWKRELLDYPRMVFEKR
jgi:hypothetical protein